MQPFKLLTLCIASCVSSLTEVTTTSDQGPRTTSVIAPVEIEIHLELEVFGARLPQLPSRTQDGSQPILALTTQQPKAAGLREAVMVSSTSNTQDVSGWRASMTDSGMYPATNIMSQSTTAAGIFTSVLSNTSLKSDHVLDCMSSMATARSASGFRWNPNVSHPTARPANLSLFTGAAAASELSWSLGPLIIVLLLV